MLSFLKQNLKSPAAHIALILLVCVLTYLPILSHSFVYDDTTLFLTWKTPKSLGNMQKFIEGDAPSNHGGNYRPVRTFIYAADYKLWGDRAAGYYAQAILVNAAIAVFVYLIARAIAAHSVTGLVTALLFGVHPMHTESISFATASMDTIGLLFGFASIYFAITSKRMGGGRFYLSLILMLLGFFTYEVVLITPVLLALFFYCFNHPQKKNDAPRYRSLVWYGGAVVYYGIIRLLLMHQPTARPVTYHGGSFFMNGIIISKFFYQYIAGLIFPFRLSVFHEIAHGVDTFMMSDSAVRHMPLLDWQNALTVAIVATSAVVAWRMYKPHPIVTFCIGWFYVAMIPVLNILPSHSLFAERYVFFASFGFALLSAWLITRLKPSYAAPLATGLILIYVVGTIYRNTEWQNPMTLWSEVRRSAAHSPVGWNGVGLELENQGNHEQAMKYFQKAISLNKTYPNAHTNLGTLYFSAKKYDLALTEFEDAVKYDPYNRDTQTNLVRARRIIDAEAVKKMSPEDRKEHEETAHAISEERQFIAHNEPVKALSILEQALKKYPKHADLLNDAAVIYMSQGKFDKSIAYLKQATTLKPDEPDYFLNLGHAFLGKGDKVRAEAAFRLALVLKPDFGDAQAALDSLK